MVYCRVGPDESRTTLYGLYPRRLSSLVSLVQSLSENGDVIEIYHPVRSQTVVCWFERVKIELSFRGNTIV